MRLASRHLLSSSAAALTFLVLVGCQPAPKATEGLGDTDRSSDQRSPSPGAVSDGAVLRVLGMSCPKCVTNVELQLAKVDGVTGSQINMQSGTVTVQFAAGSRPSDAALGKAVSDAGLTLVSITPVARQST
jgi:copper chaperone CopZ